MTEDRMALALSLGDHNPRPAEGDRRRAGRVLSRALGTRALGNWEHPRRIEDATARGAVCAAQHDPGAGPAGVLEPAVDAFHHARAYAETALKADEDPTTSPRMPCV
jgi:hypothetical protein